MSAIALLTSPNDSEKENLSVLILLVLLSWSLRRVKSNETWDEKELREQQVQLSRDDRRVKIEKKSEI